MDVTCPRCGSTDLFGVSGISAGCEYSQTVCDDCGHAYGDGLPDEAAVPLPEGFSDCGRCAGSGGNGYGLDCRPCQGRGIVAETGSAA